jgi:dTDP-4-dehydrorhamnose 3,5-epimerase
MIKPNKFVSNQFKDNRGNLVEIIPKEIKKKFVYSILTESKKNVVRGMHFNKKMDEEKLVFILDGKILDVTINLNKGKNFGKIFYNKLKKGDVLFIPKGFAHGYCCLNKKNTILYLLNKKYSIKNNYGFAWNDKNFNINWKIKNPILSGKDYFLKEYKKK